MLQDQIANRVPWLDPQRCLKGQAALLGDVGGGSGANDGDAQGPAGPGTCLGKREEEGQQDRQWNADDHNVDDQWMEGEVPDLVEHRLSPHDDDQRRKPVARCPLYGYTTRGGKWFDMPVG